MLIEEVVFLFCFVFHLYLYTVSFLSAVLSLPPPPSQVTVCQ